MENPHISLSYGDRIKGDKYSILMQIGRGGQSTVWLAKDTSTAETVVLKISATGDVLGEASIYQDLFKASTRAPNVPILKLLDEFAVAETEKYKPDRVHHCLVLEPMALTAWHLVQKFHPPISAIKTILRQTLIALDYLHSSGFVHGDLHEGNILISSRDMSTAPIDVCAMRLIPKGIDVKLWDEQVTQLTDDSPLHVKLADFGSSFPMSKAPTRAICPREYRSPEHLISTPKDPIQLNHKIDIWSFGLMMFKLLTRSAFFKVSIQNFENESWKITDDRHLLQMVDMMKGNFPAGLDIKWGRREEYFLKREDDARWREVDKGAGVRKDKICRGQSVEEGIRKAIESSASKGKKAPNVTTANTEERQAISRIVSMCLALDRDLRPEAKQLLQDSFFRMGC